MPDCAGVDVGHAMHVRALADLDAGADFAETAVAVLLDLVTCDMRLGDDHAAPDVGFATRSGAVELDDPIRARLLALDHRVTDVGVFES